MDVNPYQSPGDITANGQIAAADVATTTRRRLRWQIVPATLSWFAAALLMVGVLVWLGEMASGIVRADAYAGFWLVAASVTLVLLASAMLNFWAGRRWMRYRYASAVIFNGGSGLLIWGVTTVLEWYFRVG